MMIKINSFATILAVAALLLVPASARLNVASGHRRHLAKDATTTTTAAATTAAAMDAKEERHLSSSPYAYTITVQTSSKCIDNDQEVQGLVVANVKTQLGVPVMGTTVHFALTSNLSDGVYSDTTLTNSNGSAFYAFSINPIDEGTFLDCSITVENENLPNPQTATCIFQVVEFS